MTNALHDGFCEISPDAYVNCIYRICVQNIYISTYTFALRFLPVHVILGANDNKARR